MASIGVKTGILVVARFMTRGMQLVSFVVLARALSVEQFGNYGVLTSAVFLAALIGNLGLRQAAAHSLGRGEIESGQIASTLLVVWPLLSAACCAALWFMTRAQFDLLSFQQSVAVYVSIFAILCLTLLQGILLGRGETNRFALLDSGPRVVQSLLVVGLWLAGLLDVLTALASFAVGFLLFVPVAIKHGYAGAGIGKPKLSALPGLFRFGFLFAASLFVVMLQGRVGLFFLHGTEGAREAGNFFAAQRAAEIFLDVATAAALVLFSETARATDTRAALISSVRVALSMIAVFAVIGLAGVLVAPFAVRVLLGSGYGAAQDALMVLCLGLGPAAATRIMNSVMSGMGRPWISALIAIGGLMVNLAVCSVAISRWGATGAALALVAGQTTCCIIYFVAIRRLFGLGLREALPNFRAAAGRLKKVLRRRRP